MLSRKIALLLFLGALVNSALAQKNDPYREYVNRYKELAISEMDRTGIPASIKLAQALLESAAGQSDLARQANNHFGIKCGGGWTGGIFEKIDDDRDHLGRPVKSCFREYRNPEESFLAHSEFLRQSRYAKLFELDRTDYKGWARGLREAGYATSKDYPRKLIDLIERYGLNEFDSLSSGGMLASDERSRENRKHREKEKNQENPVSPPVFFPSAERAFEVSSINDVRYIVARQEQPVSELAKLAGVSSQELLRYNENLQAEAQLVPAGMRVFLQPKRSQFRGRQQWHLVSGEETLISISQTYAVSIDHLMRRNKLSAGEEPVAGARLKLRGATVQQAPRTYRPGQPGNGDPVLSPDGKYLDMELEGRPVNSAPQPAITLSQQPTPTPPGGVNNRPEKNKPQDPVSKPQPWPDTPVDTKPSGNGQDQKPQENKPGTQPEEAIAYHTVQRGETLWSISQRYATTVERIRQLNSLTDNSIRSGMQLRVR